MKLGLVLLINLLIFTACRNENNVVGGGNIDHPILYLQSNIDYPLNYIYENDTIKIKHSDFFDLNKFMEKDIIKVEGFKETLTIDNLIENVKIWINPLDSNELFIKGLEPNYNNTGWYSLTEYDTYRISLAYSEFDTNLSNKGYLFNIRESRKP